VQYSVEILKTPVNFNEKSIRTFLFNFKPVLQIVNVKINFKPRLIDLSLQVKKKLKGKMGAVSLPPMPSFSQKFKMENL